MTTVFVPETLLLLSAPILFLHAARARGRASAVAFFAAGAFFGLLREPLFTRWTGLYEYAPGTLNAFGVPLYLALGWTTPFYLGSALARDGAPGAAPASRALLGGAVAALAALPIEVVAIQPETSWWTWRFVPAHALFSSPALVGLGWFLSATLFLAAAEFVDARVKTAARRPPALVALVPFVIAAQTGLLLLARAAIPFFR